MGVRDPLVAYLLDRAVVAFGTVVENALQETVTLGAPGKTTRQRRYTLAQLLDPTFTLPAPEPAARGIGAFKRWAGQHGIRSTRGTA